MSEPSPRNGVWIPNYSKPQELTKMVGKVVSWEFDGYDEVQRPWWVTKDENGDVILRVPHNEILFKATIVTDANS